VLGSIPYFFHNNFLCLIDYCPYANGAGVPKRLPVVSCFLIAGNAWQGYRATDNTWVLPASACGDSQNIQSFLNFLTLLYPQILGDL